MDAIDPFGECVVCLATFLDQGGFELCDAGLQGAALRIERREFSHQLVIGVVVNIGAINGGEHGLKGVVVALADGIKLVIVALRAVDGHGLEGVDRVCDHVVTVEVARNLAVGLGFWDFGVSDQIPRARSDEAERGNPICGAGIEGVTGDLFLDKARVGFVAVERADHVIAIGPRVRTGLIFVVAVGFAEVDDVEPVAGPSFTVVW